MIEGWLFKKALLLIAGLSAMPYLTWSLFSLGTIALIFNKFRPMHAWQTHLLAVWWVLIVVGISLAATLLIAWLSVPKNDPVANTVMQLALIASLPIFIPCLVSFFFKPTIH